MPTYRQPVRVILLHGLWLRAFTLARLAARLRAAGFEPELLDFGSVRDEPEQTIARLRERLHALAAGAADPGHVAMRADSAGNPAVPAPVGAPAAIVGHSLGGLLALQALQAHPELPVSRVVCLGSPLRGSRAAQALAGHGAGRWMLGHSRRLLCAGLTEWTGPAEAGVIAGCLPVGLGFALARMPRPHDGTVCAEETRLPGLTDHVEVRTTHTGLLFSRAAADQAIHFLRHGVFARPAARPQSPL